MSLSRIETILSGGEVVPQSRIEKILVGEDIEPQSRIEALLKEKLGGGGGGTEITDGIVVKARDAAGHATEIDFYGCEIFPYTFGVDLAYTPDRKTLLSEVETINWMDDISSVKSYAFAQGFNGTTIITLPTCPCTFSQYAFGRYQARVNTINIPGGGTFESEALRQFPGLKIANLGSIGFPILSLPANTFSYDTQSDLAITAYCGGEKADTLLANIRNGATNATIIIKASEDTTYNGTSYAAGETMITSTVEATA